MGIYVYMMQTKTVKTIDGDVVCRGRYTYKANNSWMRKPSKFEAVTIPCMESYASAASAKLAGTRYMINEDKFVKGAIVFDISQLHRVPDVYEDHTWPGFRVGTLAKKGNRWIIDFEFVGPIKEVRHA